MVATFSDFAMALRSVTARKIRARNSAANRLLAFEPERGRLIHHGRGRSEGRVPPATAVFSAAA